jgi:hypothetical protein
MISTKDLKSSEGSSIPKVITPGANVCKINNISLEVPPFDKNAYNVVMNVETLPIDGFEGFFISKDNPELGRHLGQVGRVKASEYAYKDGTTKTGITVSRDMDILKAIQTICKVTDSLNWMEDNDSKHETIEDFVTAFNTDAPFKDKFIRMCIGGKEYLNKEGYTNFDLFLVRNQRGAYNMESNNISEDQSKLIKFDSDLHIKKKKVDNVDSFGNAGVQTSSSVGSDFEL